MNETPPPIEESCAPSYSSALAVASLGFGTFAQVTCEFAPIGVLPEAATNFDVSSGVAGLMMTLPGIFAAVSALFVATVIRQADRKLVLLALALLLVVSSIVCAMAPTFEFLLAGRALLGICLGASWTMALSIASRVASPGKVHQAAAAVFAGVTAAMILGLPLGTLIGDATSWRITFLAGAVLGAIALLLQFLYLPKLPSGKQFKLSNHLKFLKHPSAIISLAMAYLGHAAHFGAYTYLAPTLKEASIVGSNLTYLLFAFGRRRDRTGHSLSPSQPCSLP
ncbi:MFS transporter [Pseudomonas sp. NPDC089752]|uniref:MFS transporter n=1 Tax=Pseudomonas sp. NPDC089752 TaxID=3364472 RepID=UPI00380B9C90